MKLGQDTLAYAIALIIVILLAVAFNYGFS
jgi:hypothetical protein